MEKIITYLQLNHKLCIQALNLSGSIRLPKSVLICDHRKLTTANINKKQLYLISYNYEYEADRVHYNNMLCITMEEQ